MSVTTRIRLVGAIATSVAVAVAVLVLVGVWASADDVSLGSAGALLGVLLTTTIGVALAFSLDANERRPALGSKRGAESR